jgi:hypothetical protein
LTVFGDCTIVPEAQPTPEPLPERRTARREIDMRGTLIRAGGISHLVELRDLNYGGCGIVTSVKLEPGEAVQLSALGRGPTPAEVRWCGDGKAGLDFEAPLKGARKLVDRCAARTAVPGEVGLRAQGRTQYRVRVLDLSTDGCKVELVERPAVGDHMRVKFDGIESLDAEVCWVDSHTAGLRFEQRIHPAVLDLLLRRLGAE